ncbi:MAG: hypothetical protein GX643_11505 [Acidimicrobiales bacterium]|nr:hypothetical protein [Acidimicrobiales bacterium]
MTDTTFTYDDTAAAFRYASHWWRSIVGAIDDHHWDQTGLGEWTVKELVAHTDRAYKTIITYLTADTVDPTPIATAAEYFRIVLGEETPHVHIAARARTEAAEVSDWISETDALARSCEKLVADTPGDAVCHLMVGEMELSQYLATRVTELVVHGLDLAQVLGLDVNPPPVATKIVLQLLLDVADEPAQTAVIRYLTGRPSPGVNVLS